MNTRIVFLTLLTIASGAQGAVYRCGKTFSATPCAPDAQKVNAAPASGASGAIAGGREVLPQRCLDAVAKAHAVPGLEWRIGKVERSDAVEFRYADAPMTGFQVVMSAQQFDNRGVQVDVRRVKCMISQDRQRVLSLDTP